MLQRTQNSQAGFTLIELMVGALLTLVVLGLVGGVIISSTQAEGTVRTVGDATESGQLVTSSIQNGIRNSALSLSTTTPYKLTNPSGSDQMLVALIVGSGTTATASCGAWYYSATEGSIRYLGSSSAIAAPSASGLLTWTLLAKGVSPITGSTVFTARGTYGLDLAFKISAGTASAVPFQSSITSRTGLTGAIACY